MHSLLLLTLFGKLITLSNCLDVITAIGFGNKQVDLVVFPSIDKERENIHVLEFNSSLPYQTLASNAPILKTIQTNPYTTSTAFCPVTGRFLTTYTDEDKNRATACVWRSASLVNQGGSGNSNISGPIIVDRCGDDGLSMPTGSHDSTTSCGASDWIVVYGMEKKTNGYPLETTKNIGATIIPLTDWNVDQINPSISITFANSNERNWGPIVASNQDQNGEVNYLMVWMYDIEGDVQQIQLKGAILDSVGGIKVKDIQITPPDTRVIPSSFDVVYLSKFKQYAVVAQTDKSNGMLTMVDSFGKVVYSSQSTNFYLPMGPPSSSNVLVLTPCFRDSFEWIIFPTAPTGAALVKISSNATAQLVQILPSIPSRYSWQSLGTSGMTNCKQVTMLTLENVNTLTKVEFDLLSLTSSSIKHFPTFMVLVLSMLLSLLF